MTVDPEAHNTYYELTNILRKFIKSLKLITCSNYFVESRLNAVHWLKTGR